MKYSSIDWEVEHEVMFWREKSLSPSPFAPFACSMVRLGSIAYFDFF